MYKNINNEYYKGIFFELLLSVGNQWDSINSFMDKVEDKRKNELCKHECLLECIPRGCAKCTSMDRGWKVRY